MPMAGTNKDNRRFLREMSAVIRQTPGHPLQFLLGSDRELMKLSAGNRNYYDCHDNAIYEGKINTGSLTTGRSIEIAEELGVSVSVDACHTTAKTHGGKALAIGIAEFNRSDGPLERLYIIDNYIID